LFCLVTARYVLAPTSIGIAIAVVARNLSQAIMILILQPTIFLSGGGNPPAAMLPLDAYRTLSIPSLASSRSHVIATVLWSNCRVQRQRRQCAWRSTVAMAAVVLMAAAAGREPWVDR
jgi:hypothetical protein